MSNAKVFRRKGSPYWYGWYYDAEGERQTHSTKCTERRAAQSVVERWEREAHDPTYAASNQTTLGDELEAFIKYMGEVVDAGKRSSGTLSMHRVKAGHLLRLLGARRLAALSAQDVDGFISTRRGEGAQETTINKELITLRSTLKFSRRRGLWLRDVAEVLPVAFAPGYKPRERFATIAEMQVLLPNLTDLHAARAAFMVATSANAGEAERALPEDVRLDVQLDEETVADLVFLRGTKRTSRRRTVPVVLPEHRSLLRYALERTGKERLFPGRVDAFNKALAGACRDAKIHHLCPNDLRRSYAQWMRAAAIPGELIAAGMGHSDTRMVDRVYGRMSPEVLGARIAKAAGIDCSTIAADSAATDELFAPIGHLFGRKPAEEVPRAGLEPARSFDQRILSPVALWPNSRKPKRNRDYPTGSAALLQQRKRGERA